MPISQSQPRLRDHDDCQSPWSKINHAINPRRKRRPTFVSSALAFALATLLALGGGFFAASLYPSAARAEESTAALDTLSITTSSGTHSFSVEVMRTDAERERGLMFRRYMPADRGMLFNFDVAQPVMMWMKNTYLPLDMIFMDEKGRVVSIAHDTEPLSEAIIPSGRPAYAVLEVNAGTAARIGLKVGDIVHNEIFKH